VLVALRLAHRPALLEGASNTGYASTLLRILVAVIAVLPSFSRPRWLYRVRRRGLLGATVGVICRSQGPYGLVSGQAPRRFS
jgi:hypothetical protein